MWRRRCLRQTDRGRARRRLGERHGVVYVNDRKLDEPYIEHERRDLQSHQPVRLSADQYYLLGDNRAASCDSRVFGPVDRDLIIGKAYAIYWPLKRIRRL